MAKQKKLNWFKFYPSDWINDTRSLSGEAKGAWIDILCLMWNSPQRGVWSGTYQDFARATGLPWEIAPRIVTELSRTASLVTKRDTEVTLECRRMVREESHYNNHAKRQAEYMKRRNNDAIVTNKMLDVRSKEERKKKEESGNDGARATASASPKGPTPTPAPNDKTAQPKQRAGNAKPWDYEVLVDPEEVIDAEFLKQRI